MYQFSESQINVECHHFKNCNYYRVLYGLASSAQLDKNRNFQNDGASWYFGLWLWELVHLPALSSGIFIFVFGTKLYRSCHIRDKGPLSRLPRSFHEGLLEGLVCSQSARQYRKVPPRGCGLGKSSKYVPSIRTPFSGLDRLWSLGAAFALDVFV